MNILFSILGLLIILAVPIFIITSIILFIRDGILAKREERKRDTGYTVLFIISMAIIAVIIAFCLFLYMLSMLVVKGM